MTTYKLVNFQNFQNNPELIHFLSEGPHFQEKEALMLKKKCEKLMNGVSKCPSEEEQKKLTNLTLSDAHAINIISQTKGLCPRYIEQTKAAYVTFFNENFKKPAQVVIQVTNIFKSLEKDYISIEKAQEPEIKQRFVFLTEQELARRHAFDVLEGTKSHLPDLAQRCKDSYDKVIHSLEDDIPLPPTRDSLSDESPRDVSSLFRKKI